MSVIHKALKKLDRKEAEGSSVFVSGGKSAPPPPAAGKSGPSKTRVIVLLLAILITGAVALFMSADIYTDILVKIGVVKAPKYELAPGIGPPPDQAPVPIPEHLKDVQPQRSQAPAGNNPGLVFADPVQARLAGIYNKEGEGFFAEGRFDEARDKFLEALRRAPVSAEYNNNVGLALKALGRISDAQTHYKRAVELDPSCAECMNNLAVLWMQSGQEDQAKALFQEALGIRPDYAEAHLNLAILLERRGEWEQAAGHYGKYRDLAGDLDPELLKSLNRRIRLGG